MNEHPEPKQRVDEIINGDVELIPFEVYNETRRDE